MLKKIDKLLAEAGSSKSKILWANVWLTDMREKDQMDAAWQAWVDPNNKPARATVESRLGHARYARRDHDDRREVV